MAMGNIVKTTSSALTNKDNNIRDVDWVVVSSRVRLARNLAGYPFPHRIKNIEQAHEIAEALRLPLEQLDDFRFSYLDDLNKEEMDVFKENYLISQLLIDRSEISAVFVNSDETVSIMVNEEDHIREQYCARGLCLLKAHEYLNGIDDMIEACVKLAYDEKLGYLTACPSNLGTGMRASVMMFLPALTKLKKLRDWNGKFLSDISDESGYGKIRMTMRGVYGEGSGFDGFMYQISNETTLGCSEEEILSKVTDYAMAVAGAEMQSRRELYEQDRIAVEDACGRAYGILTHCAKIGYDEFLQLMADLKFGVSVGVYSVKHPAALDELIIAMRDYNIDRYFTVETDRDRLDICRAELLRDKLPKIVSDGVK